MTHLGVQYGVFRTLLKGSLYNAVVYLCVNGIIFHLSQAQLRASVFLALEEQESQQVKDEKWLD